MTAFVGSLMVVIGLSIMQRGIFGVFWIFPAILLINFLAYGRLAKIYTGIFLVYISVVMFSVLEPQIAARAVTGLLVTILLTNIFLGVIDKLQTELVEQSSLDPLTGALNRRSMDPIMTDAIERKRRTQTPASLLVLDVDEFKSVNDTFGHALGDHVLKELVSTIGSRARIMDKLFRLGGEEFILFLPDTDGAGAATLAEELRLTVSATHLVDGRVITISIGISELEHGESVDEWIKRGDDALFEAKALGRNRSIVGRSKSDYGHHLAGAPPDLPVGIDLRY
jgi:diguanylate cyclase (GGDEF)-like protein